MGKASALYRGALLEVAARHKSAFACHWVHLIGV